MMISLEKEEYLAGVEQLFNNYYTRLCDFAGRILQDDELAQDIVQDVFVKICECQHELPSQELAIKSFLYSSVKYASFNKLRHLKIINKYAEQACFEEHTPALMEQIIHAEVMNEIYNALEELPKGCALIFKKGYLEGLKNTEIAQELNISINTVKSQKQRALSLLKEKLNPQLISLFLPFILHRM